MQMPDFPLTTFQPRLRPSRSLRSICAGPGATRHDALWQRIDRRLWRRTQNPWTILQRRFGRRLRVSPRIRLSPRSANGSPGLGKAYIEAARLVRNDPSARPAFGGVAYLQHGVRARRCAAALCRRARRPGRRFSEDRQRSRLPGRRRRTSLPGGLFPPDHRRRGHAAGSLSVQRPGARCRSGRPSMADGRLAAHSRSSCRAAPSICASGRRSSGA